MGLAPLYKIEIIKLLLYKKKAPGDAIGIKPEPCYKN